ncbi:MAG: glycosyltransferase [Pirellulaceae bacterium]|nr:glycosyltransferase [Pirellulaceae bacterium]
MLAVAGSRTIRRATLRDSICQLTSAHALDDERILHRMAWSAQRLGYRSQVAGPAATDGHYAGITLHSVYDRTAPGLWNRRLLAWLRLAWWALRSNFRVFHLHDPDLLLTGMVLRLCGRKVIYDVHDDYQAAFQTRLRGRPVLRALVPRTWWLLERNAARLFQGVIVADHHLARKFRHCQPVILGNYPRLDFTRAADTSRETTFNLLYVGGVSRYRGLHIVAQALQLLPQTDLRLHIVGTCREAGLRDELTADARVVLHGQVEWTRLHTIYERAHVGLAIYQPIPEFVTVDHSAKIIEYMAAGLPIITADFPGLRRFVQEPGCGVVVDPTSPTALAAEIDSLYKDPQRRLELGRRGRKLFEAEYHWEQHEPKLAALYGQLRHHAPVIERSAYY